MAKFSQTDLRNASSRVFLGTLLPSTLGGQKDAEEMHQQILELSKTVFVLNPLAIYALANIIKNKLNAALSKEIDLVEDMLASLEDLVRLSSLVLPPNSATHLKNAITNLLNIESSASLSGRVELTQFTQQIDSFSSNFKQLTRKGKLRLHPDEVKDVLKKNFQELIITHDRLLLLSVNLADLLDVYNAFDLPSSLSNISLAKVRKELQLMVDTLEKGDATTNQRTSRVFLLSSLSAKAAVNALADFSVPNKNYTLRSDGTGFSFKGIIGGSTKGLGSGPPFKFRITGSVVPAEVLSNQGPWPLDTLTQNNLIVSVDGGPNQTIDFSSITGPGIHGNIEGPWPDVILHPSWPGPQTSTEAPPPLEDDYLNANELHIVVDSATYILQSSRWGYIRNDGVSLMEGEDTASGIAPAPRNTTVPTNIPDTPPTHNGFLVADYWTTVRCQPPIKLGFKHLGVGVTFELSTVIPGSSSSSDTVDGAGFSSWSVSGTDQLEKPGSWASVETTRWHYLTKPRVLTELTLLKNVVVTINDSIITGPSGSFESHFVGFYIRTSIPERYEIIRYISDTQVEIDFRGDIVSNQTVGVFGTRGDYTQFSFNPDLLINTRDVADSTALGPHNVRDTVRVILSPAIKTTSIPSGLSTGSIAEVVAALNSSSNGSHGDNTYAHASKHFIFKETPGTTNKLTIEGRSRFKPDQVRLTTQFSRFESSLPNLSNAALLSGSAATLSSISSGRQTWSGLTGITETDVGKAIIISGAATSANNGTFQIVDITRQTPTDPNVALSSGAAISGSPTVLNLNGTGTDANNGSISWQLVRAEEAFVPPKDPTIITNSALKALGFFPNQKPIKGQTIYLEQTDLSRILNSSLSGATTSIINDVILTGVATTTANSFSVVDVSVPDFSGLGVETGMFLQLLEGEDSGEFIISSISNNIITVEFKEARNSRGFLANSSARYKIISKKVSIKSNSTSRGSSVQISSSPSILGFPSTVQYGSGFYLEAVNSSGDLLNLSGLSGRG